MEQLIRTYRLLLDNTDTKFVRYLHDKIAWESRLIAILGARGVGKTTLLLQHIKLYGDVNRSLFVTADDLYFSYNTLISLASKFYSEGGKILYIDEIHKYPNWSREVKNIYDTQPQLQVVYTGSSILELERGGADLSRRKLEYKLEGLSFREFINISRGIAVRVHTLDEILTNSIEFPLETERPLLLFKEYLQQGYYPFFKDTEYHIRLLSVLNQILENDIPDFAQMNVPTVAKLKKLLYIIAMSVPFKPNFSKLARDLDISRNSISDLMLYLEKAGVINQLRDETNGISLLGKVEKVYLSNPNLSYAISADTPNIGNVRETIFLALLRVTHPVLNSKIADFVIDNRTFEVGGKSKGQRQIEGVDNAYIVKDDIEYGYNNILPLWAFGLLY